MAGRFQVSTEFAFLFSGVFIMVVAWALNLLGILSGDQPAGHGSGDIYLWLMLMLQGLAFSTVGVVYSNYQELIVNPDLARRYVAGFLLIADGGIHLFALNQHLNDAPAAAFFAVVSPIQILGGIVFPHLARRREIVWLLFTAFLIAAYIATRTVAIWPIGVVEEVDPLGVISKVVEVLTLWVLILLVRAARRKRPDRDPSAPVESS